MSHTADSLSIGISLVFPPFLRCVELLNDGSDIITDKPRFGVQIRPLKKILLDTDVKVAVSRLRENPLDHLKLSDIVIKMNRLYKKYGNMDWGITPATLTPTGCCGIIKLLSCCIKGDDRMYCTELVSNILLDFGIIDTDPEFMSIEDFTESSIKWESPQLLTILW